MKQDERTPVYTEGVCGDGAMILRDGQPFPISSAIDALNAYTSTEALRSALEKHSDFFTELWRASTCDGAFDVEYADLVELALEHGLLIKTEFDPEKHEPNEFYPEPGDDWYVESGMARAALSGSPAPSTEGLSEWLPIETAPKDGTEILTFSARIGLGQMVVSWADGYWREKANGLGLKYEPTDWQPLPPAPDAARTALAGVTAPQPDIEELIVAAYERGFQWCVENANDPEAAAYVDKAARDYADYTMNAPPDGVTAPSEVDGK